MNESKMMEKIQERAWKEWKTSKASIILEEEQVRPMGPIAAEILAV